MDATNDDIFNNNDDNDAVDDDINTNNLWKLKLPEILSVLTR